MLLNDFLNVYNQRQFNYINNLFKNPSNFSKTTTIATTSTHQTHDLNNQQLNGHKKYKNEILHQEFR